MNITQVAREAAERWHRFNLNYPELAERALHETIEGAIKACIDASTVKASLQLPVFFSNRDNPIEFFKVNL